LANDALRLSDVDAFYGDSHALHRVSFGLAEGRLLGLLGRNGAGKSTCMNVAVGLLPPRTGAVELFGAPVTRLAPEDIAARGVALVPQGRRIFKSLTVRENLTVAARRGTSERGNGAGAPASTGADAPTRRPDWSLETVFDMFPRLGERRRQMAIHLSGGEQQMLAIGRALMANPRVLLLDEPSEGLAPQIVAEVMATIRTLKESGLSIVLVEQNPKLVFGMADDIVILNSGQVVAAGPAGELREREGDLRQHLGVF
jgi:branched-chain amino acid transport system ATP-binding protein